MKHFTSGERGGTFHTEVAAAIPRGMRDLAALATLPSIWVESDIQRSVQNLADVLRTALHALAVGIRIELPDGSQFDTAASEDLSNANHRPHEAAELLNAVEPDSAETTVVREFRGRGRLNASVQPVFFDGKRIGYFVACFSEEILPSPTDRLLLHVAACQVALLLQRHKDQEERLNRQIAEDRLRQAERNYRQIVQSLPAAVYTCDREGHITLYNKAAVELWGQEPSLNGDHQRFCAAYRCWIDGIPLAPQDTPMAVAAREGKSFRNLEPVFERPDGSRVPVLVNIDPIFDAEGRPAGAINIFQDVTQLKSTEEQLRASEDRFRLLSVCSPVGIFSTDGDGRCTYANPRLCELCGITAEQALGYGWAERIHPEDRARVVEGWRSHTQRRLEYSSEFRWVHPMRGIRWVHVRAIPMQTDKDRPERFIGTLEDITERKTAEEKLRENENTLRSFYESSPLLMGVIELPADDSDIYHIYDSPATERFFGLPRGSTARKSARELGVSPEFIDQWIGHYRTSERENRPVRFEYAHVMGDRSVWLYCVVSCIGPSAPGRTRFSYVVEDATVRKEAVEALRESQRRLSTLMANLPGMAYRCPIHTPWSLEFVSEGVLQLTGWRAEEFRQQRVTWRGIMHPDDLDTVKKEMETALREQRIFSVAYRITHRAGGIRWVLDRGQPVFDEAGVPVAFEGFVGDLTEQKRAEQALRDSEVRFRSLVNSVEGIVWECVVQEKGFRFTFVSDQAERLLGYRTEEWMTNPNFWADHIHPEDREEALRFCAARTREMSDHQFEYRMIAADGRAVWLRDFVTVIAEKDQPVKLVGVMVDISESRRAQQALRESEERFRAVIDNSPTVIYVKDAQGKYLLVNKCYERLFHVVERDILGKTDFDLFPVAAAQKFSSNDSAVLSSGKEVQVEELAPQDDGIHTYISIKFPLRKSDGSIAAIAGISTDITERKRAELLLRGQKEALQLIAEDKPLAAIMEKVIEVVEEHSSGLIGSVLLIDGDGMHLRPFAGKRLPTGWTQTITAVKIGPCAGSCGTAAHRREAVIVEDISTDPLWAEFRDAALDYGLKACWCIPIRDSDGEVLGTFAGYYLEPRRPTDLEWKVFEILAQTAALAIERQKTREAQRKLTALIEHSPNFIGVADFDQRVLFINPAGQALVGLAPERVPQTKILDYFPESEKQRIEREILPELSRRHHWDGEVLFRHFRTGELIPVMWNVFLIPDPNTGAPAFYACVSTDITGRKKAEAALRDSEERYRTLVSVITDVPWITDPAGAFVTRQPAWEKYTGQTWEEHRAFGWLQALHPDDRDKLYALWQHACETRGVYRVEGRLWHAPTRTYRYFAARATALLDGDGSVREWVGTCTDIDDEKRASEKLEKAVAERTASLQQAIAQMEEFSYTVSHDLRAPVRAIEGYARILDADYRAVLPPTGQSYLDRISRSAARMHRLINDVLTLSRAARHQLDLRKISLRPLIEEVIEHYPEMQPPCATIEFGELHSVVGDDVSLTQAISNLLSNAVKFVDPGVRPHVRVWSERRGDKVRLCIRDNGIGIKPELQAKLFGIFQRLRPNDGYDGTGVGLAIVRKAIERMDGSVGVESDGVHGSNFWIELSGADPS